MQLFYGQLIGCIALVICSITLGILLKKYPSKSFAVGITVIFHMVVFSIYIVPFIMVLSRANFTHYDVMLGIPLLGFQSGLKIVGTVIALLGFCFILISVLSLMFFGQGLPAVILSVKLAVRGIYTYTRNPMSLGFYLICIAIGLWEGSTFLILWSLIVLIPAHIFFLKFFEERELESRFGQPYIEYKKRVPFLIPNLRNIFKPEKSTRGV